MTGQFYIVGIRLTFMYGNHGIETIDVGKTEDTLEHTPHFQVGLGFHALFNGCVFLGFPTYRRMFTVTNGMKELILNIDPHKTEIFSPIEMSALSNIFTPLSLHG
jgi:hypothetical protein